MTQEQGNPESGRFGRYLREIRESRKLSLDAVEEMATGYPERITKSHLSRIENGLAEPTFRRLYTLSQIYGVPVTSLAEQFEIELRRASIARELDARSDDDVLEAARAYRVAGRYVEALDCYDHLLERARADLAATAHGITEIEIHRINCLIQLGQFNLAKEGSERILDSKTISSRERLLALQYFAMACYRTGRLTIALFAISEAESQLRQMDEPGRFPADLAMIKGNVLDLSERPADAVAEFRRAVEGYEAASLPFDRCRAQRNLAAVLIDTGELDPARGILEEVLETANAQGYDRQKAYALSDLGLLHWKRQDWGAAESYCIQSNALARPREYLSLVFRNSFYLWKIALQREDDRAARSNERTLRAYVSRVEQSIAEVKEFRTYIGGTP